VSDLDDFYMHTVTVRTLTGSGAMGDIFADPADLACFVDDKTRLVRAADASQIVSSSTLYAPAGTTTLTPGSEVDLPSGRTATVITAAVRTSGPLDLPDHVEAALT
jgi:hypothetical protein